MMTTPSLHLKNVAFHEAGHAVADFLYWRPIPNRVWVGSSGSGAVEVRTEQGILLLIAKDLFLKNRELYEEMKEHLYHEVCSLLAGPISEWKCRGQRLSGLLADPIDNPDSDLSKVKQILTELDRIEFGGGDISSIQQVLQDKVARLLRRNGKPWKAVTMLAEQLLTHEKMSGEAVWDLCERCGLTYGEKANQPLRLFPQIMPMTRYHP